MAKNTTLRKLDLRGESYFTVPVLHGVAGNTTIEDLEVSGELIEGYFTYHENGVIIIFILN